MKAQEVTLMLRTAREAGFKTKSQETIFQAKQTANMLVARSEGTEEVAHGRTETGRWTVGSGHDVRC